LRVLTDWRWRGLVEGGKGPLAPRDGTAATHPIVTFCVLPNLIEWFYNQILRYSFEHFLGTNARLLLDPSRRISAMFARKTKLQSERLMADVYLGIMIAGVNTLVVFGSGCRVRDHMKAASVAGRSAPTFG
jgi:hypothetical protein